MQNICLLGKNSGEHSSLYRLIEKYNIFFSNSSDFARIAPIFPTSIARNYILDHSRVTSFLLIQLETKTVLTNLSVSSFHNIFCYSQLAYVFHLLRKSFGFQDYFFGFCFFFFLRFFVIFFLCFFYNIWLMLYLLLYIRNKTVKKKCEKFVVL